MTGLPPQFLSSRRREHRAFGFAALLCLALLALLITAQVAHVHPVESDADHCSLCIALHSAAPVAVLAAAVALIKIGSPQPLVEARAVVRPWRSKLYTRPPPVGC